MEPKRETSKELFAIQQELIAREPLFHREEFGRTREAFDAMITPDYWEIGASGKRYSREFVLDSLVKRYSELYQESFRAEEFYCQEIAANNYLLTYTLYQGSRKTRRCTIWRRSSDQWMAFFHQGTVVAE